MLFLPAVNGTFRPKTSGVAWACSDTPLLNHSAGKPIDCISAVFNNVAFWSVDELGGEEEKVGPLLVVLVAFLSQHYLTLRKIKVKPEGSGISHW